MKGKSSFPAWLFQQRAMHTPTPLTEIQLERKRQFAKADKGKKLQAARLSVERLVQLPGKYATLLKASKNLFAIQALAAMGFDRLCATVNQIARERKLGVRLVPKARRIFSKSKVPVISRSMGYTGKTEIAEVLPMLIGTARNLTTQEIRERAKRRVAGFNYITAQRSEKSRADALKLVAELTDGQIMQATRAINYEFPSLKLTATKYAAVQLPPDVVNFLTELLHTRKLGSAGELRIHLRKMLAERTAIEAVARLPETELLRSLRIQGILPSERREIGKKKK